ncbi:S-adenosylmethionine:tRNA ribosyltransferase-isomerase [Hazenella sp. IB182357]|uniref:S-adenosylmethionine:tRNA ribosyltransferase-isomerase n=1 Tax=Polycladospora coralii TaxID=2771432 RepID=A0A926NBD6_9BACL|nr:S-adenosylmethionine:tRNA ribosyltransferase-isomerase [Polycladospora coralii]MBD1373462.1 S-adenosylmethionine:tRNA ribosyltransferase-isomerase [Polycladospora coralii]
MTAPILFHLPNDRNATAPPERRGIRRDQVGLMVSDRKTGDSQHTRFDRLIDFLNRGDTIVLNASRTIPAVLYGEWRRDQSVLVRRLEVRLAKQLSEQTWEVLPVKKGMRVGDEWIFSSQLKAEVIATDATSPLVTVKFSLEKEAFYEQIYRLGEPIRYEYIKKPWSLDYYQTVFATTPGSVELPSAGRAFSWELLIALRKKGINIVFLTLHTGLSYYLDDSYVMKPERNCEDYEVAEEAIATIAQTKKEGGKVIAVGTTVVRALESVVEESGQLQAQKGRTCVKIDAHTKLAVVDGLITGFHEPEASHLDLLNAFTGSKQLSKMYKEALTHQYLWHEFGDIHLLM